MIQPAVFGGSRLSCWVAVDAEFITIRGLLPYRRRIPLERVVAIVDRGTLVVWCTRGRLRRTRIGFFGTGRGGVDMSFGRGRALQDWFVGALQDRFGGGKKVVQHMEDEPLLAEARVAHRVEKWTRSRDPALHKLWAKRVRVLEGELDRGRGLAPSR